MNDISEGPLTPSLLADNQRLATENERHEATLAKIRTIVTGHEAALVVGRVLAALDEGSTQPEGTKP